MAIGTHQCAASMAVMRLGCHFAEYRVMQGDIMLFGVIRPRWDVEGTNIGPPAFGADGHY